MIELKLNGLNELPQPLSEKEEEKYVHLAYKGDELAKDLLVKHNMRLVIYIANKYKNTKIEPEDLISIGTLGLMKAIHHYNPEKKIKLSTFASKCIENEILMNMRKTKKHSKNVSIQNSLHEDKEGNEFNLSDLLGTKKEEIEEKVEVKDDIIELKKIIEKLPMKEKEIIMFRYGIDCEKMKQSEIAKKYEISQSYISRIEKRILKKIKKEFGKTAG